MNAFSNMDDNLETLATAPEASGGYVKLAWCTLLQMTRVQTTRWQFEKVADGLQIMKEKSCRCDWLWGWRLPLKFSCVSFFRLVTSSHVCQLVGFSSAFLSLGL